MTTEAPSELQQAQEKIIALMEKAHAMEVKTKDQEIEALNVKFIAQSERAGAKMTRLAEQVGEKDKQITELKETNEKQKAIIEELEAQLAELKVGGPASARGHRHTEQKLGQSKASGSGLFASLLGSKSGSTVKAKIDTTITADTPFPDNGATIKVAQRSAVPDAPRHAKIRNFIAKSFESELNDTLTKVCEDVANKTKTDRSKGEPDAVWFAMIIKKEKYRFDPKILDGGVYWEYELNTENLFILKYACRDNEEGTRVANKTQSNLLEMTYEAYSASTN